ncbi:DUF4062 domain-containing protein [Oceanobacillus sp. CAU 1775]
MERKLQVFVSSTFTDLQEERQAAVSSILNAGHIPAGMELFKAGDESQKETIKRWINESDAYMVILGGRYGSIDKDTGKSYTHWEYDYAGEKGIPRFAIVIAEDALEEKLKANGSRVMETKNPQKLKEFREIVLSKHSKFFADIKDIKLYVLESLKEFERDATLTGWVSGEKLGSYEELLEENRELLKENNKIKHEKEKLEGKLKTESEIGDYSYAEIHKYLSQQEINFPDDYDDELLAGKSYPLLSVVNKYKNSLSIGIENSNMVHKNTIFIFYRVAPKLIALGLAEKVKIAGVKYQRVQFSNNGNRFIAMYEMKKMNSQ